MSVYHAKDMIAGLNKIRTTGSGRKGQSTGYASLDDYLYLSRGYLSVVTGIPASGKSEWMDGVAVNMAYEHGWRWVIFSPENYPIEEHLRKMVEKAVGKNLRQMSEDEMVEGVEWLDEHFVWLYPEDTPSLAQIIKLAEAQNEEKKCHGLIIDPWNELSHTKSHGIRDDQYIGEQLTEIRRFGRRSDMHVCIVAHPTKMVKDANGGYPVPTPYDINGGAMWRNKADFCITCHRNNVTVNRMEVHVQKMKFKSMGKVGIVELDYDRESGRFKGVDESTYELPGEQPPF
jgi:twinkle protein